MTQQPSFSFRPILCPLAEGTKHHKSRIQCLSMAISVILGLMVLHRWRSGPIDGQAALEKAEELLTKTHVQGPFTLHSLRSGPYWEKQMVWSIEFTTSRGAIIVDLDASTALPLRIVAPSHPRDDREPDQPPTPESLKRLADTVAALGYKGVFDVGSDVGYKSVPAGARFYVRRLGHPFFNLNPSYAHSISINQKTGAVEWFGASPTLPPVNVWIPLVDGSVAVRKLQAWGHELALKRHTPAIFDPINKTYVPEVGYWLFKNQSTARLVWRATEYTTMHGNPYGLGALRMFVDAVTGELLTPDDPGWGGG